MLYLSWRGGSSIVFGPARQRKELADKQAYILDD